MTTTARITNRVRWGLPALAGLLMTASGCGQRGPWRVQGTRVVRSGACIRERTARRAQVEVSPTGDLVARLERGCVRSVTRQIDEAARVDRSEGRFAAGALAVSGGVLLLAGAMVGVANELPDFDDQGDRVSDGGGSSGGGVAMFGATALLTSLVVAASGSKHPVERRSSFATVLETRWVPLRGQIALSPPWGGALTGVAVNGGTRFRIDWAAAGPQRRAELQRVWRVQGPEGGADWVPDETAIMRLLAAQRRARAAEAAPVPSKRGGLW